MKLLLENWRDTSWQTGNEKVTIHEVIDYLSDFETVYIDVLELSKQLPMSYREPDRVAAANLDYPIIIVQIGGWYRYILDGYHRFQKAINQKVNYIKAKILILDDSKTPQIFKRVFGGTE